MSRSIVFTTILLITCSNALAMPPPPPAPTLWTRLAWACPDRKRSSIEIEVLAQGDSGYQLSVTELQIDGRKVDPSSVDGLLEMMARRNFPRIAGGYCDSSGEIIGIEERASGRKSGEAGWRQFRIGYAP